MQPTANPKQAFLVQPTAKPKRAFPVQPTTNLKQADPVQPLSLQNFVPLLTSKVLVCLTKCVRNNLWHANVLLLMVSIYCLLHSTSSSL